MAKESVTLERRAKPVGPPTKRIIEEAPVIRRVEGARLTELASELAKRPLVPVPAAVMELTARTPWVAHGNVDVYRPGRWDTSSNLIFMDTIRQVGPSVGEWDGSVAYVEFKPPSAGTYLIVVHFTGYQTTAYLNGPWGQNTAYTAAVTDSGVVLGLWTAGQGEFTLHFTVPNNEYGLGYIESIQAFAFA